MSRIQKTKITTKWQLPLLILSIATQVLGAPFITWKFGNATNLLAGWTNESGQVAQQGSPDGVIFNIDYQVDGATSTCHKIPATVLLKNLSVQEKTLTNTAKKLFVVKGSETYATNEYNFIKIITKTNNISQTQLFIYSNNAPNPNVTIQSNNGIDIVEVNIANIIGTNTVIESITIGEGVSDEMTCNYGKSYIKTRKYYSICLSDENPIKIIAPTSGTYNLGDIAHVTWDCDPNLLNQNAWIYMIDEDNIINTSNFISDIQTKYFDWQITCDNELLPGNHKFQLSYCSVTNGENHSCNSGIVGITGTNNPPQLINSNATVVSGTVPLTVGFTCSANDKEGDVIEYKWEINDNTPAQIGKDITHTFCSAGTYNVSLTLSDNQASCPKNRYFYNVITINVNNSNTFKDFFSNKETRMETSEWSKTAMTKVYRFGFYNSCQSCLTYQPRNIKLTYHHASAMTAQDQGLLFASDFDAVVKNGNNYGELECNNGFYNGNINTVFTNIYYQKTSGSDVGKIYKIYRFNEDVTGAAHYLWGTYPIPRTNFVLLRGWDPATILIVDLDYRANTLDSRFTTTIPIVNNSGINISTDNIRFYGQNSIDRLADFTNGVSTARIGCGTSNSWQNEYAGYIDITFNKNNRSLSTAEYNVFMREEYLEFSNSPTNGSYLSGGNGGRPDKSCADCGFLGGHVLANPTNKNLIYFFNGYGNHIPYINEYNVCDLSNPDANGHWNFKDMYGTPGGTVFYDEPNDQSEVVAHATWSTSGEWLYDAWGVGNATNPKGFRRMKWQNGVFINQLLYPIPRSFGMGPHSNVTADEKYAIICTYFNADETYSAYLPQNTPGLDESWVMLLDISDPNNVKSYDFCQISASVINDPLRTNRLNKITVQPLEPSPSFSHSGKFVCMQANSKVPGTTNVYITSIAVLPRDNAFSLPVNNIEPIINLLLGD